MKTFTITITMQIYVDNVWNDWFTFNSNERFERKEEITKFLERETDSKWDEKEVDNLIDEIFMKMDKKPEVFRYKNGHFVYAKILVGD